MVTHSTKLHFNTKRKNFWSKDRKKYYNQQLYLLSLPVIYTGVINFIPPPFIIFMPFNIFDFLYYTLDAISEWSKVVLGMKKPYSSEPQQKIPNSYTFLLGGGPISKQLHFFP